MFSLRSASICVVALAVNAAARPTVFTQRSTLARSDGSPLSLTFSIANDSDASDAVPYYVPLDGISYSFSVSHSSLNDGDEFGLVTVIDPGNSASFSSIQSTVSAYSSEDDVFNEAFLSTVFLRSSSSSKLSSSLISSVASKFEVNNIFASSSVPSAKGVSSAVLSSQTTIPIGPYVYRIGGPSKSASFWPVYRLYPDPQEAFLYGVTAAADGGFVRSSGNVPSAGDYTTVPVPSRLYYKESSLPLAGLRVGVKDIYDIDGLKTGCGSRAHFALYPPRNATAPAVQRLIDQGAVIVGKTKTSQFANGETATADWVDQLCPFNPRGDGYQDPSSSSSGSGAAMGAYGWLDHAIGSDTGGSIRGPAGQQGLFGIRPSHGAITLEDVMPLSDVMDTGGYFARDASSFKTFGRSWYGSTFKSFPSFPKRLMVPNDTWPVSNAASEAIFSSFISKLQTFLGAESDATGISALWTATSGVNETVQVYMNQTYATLIGAYQYDNFGLPFITDYMAANGGRAPFIDPAPKARWAYATGRGEAAFEDEGNRRVVFQDWVAKEVFKASDASCSDGILVYPQSTGRTSYRNVYFSPPTAPLGFSYGRVGPFAGVPDLVVPLGQVAYNSTISGTTEYLPVTISMVARKGCDYMLLDLISELELHGIINSVGVGKTAFTI
ncbi:amidase signature enzyme [Punctularia strigosozonata HHB-11173 SS5]|uniref:Amidase signature enzyme n=1 Tax=Punctularia strigosozonata (strain HHB-11173) TaxID=741275 RepID=R7S1A6_PUNST|nr:amidase signature enzyme [Punctularia strigosozonata HHB-11173 SS5]EIN03572.1 amidase signature enzyme [Punctularia strigosozonata HHB-11173 SS5]